MITTVLYDLDGILVKSWALIVATFDHTIAKFNLDREAFAHPRMRSCTMREAYTHLGGAHIYDECVKEHLRFQDENMHLLETFSEVSTVLSVFHRRLNQGVVSNRKRNHTALPDRFALTQYFGLIVGAEHVKKPKPDPEGILLVMKHFGSKPEETLMAGDTAVDILAGKAAGVTTVGIDRGDNMHEFKEAKPDFLFDSLLGLFHLLDPEGIYQGHQMEEPMIHHLRCQAA